MVEYLKRLLDTADAFTIDVSVKDKQIYYGAGLVAVDAIGIVFEHKNMTFVVPWASITAMIIEQA